jgi:hypothetical protein
LFLKIECAYNIVHNHFAPQDIVFVKKKNTAYSILCIFIAGFLSENAHEIMRNNLYVFSTSYKAINGFAMISDTIKLAPFRRA